MKHSKFGRFAQLVGATFLAVCCARTSLAQDYFDRYALTPDSTGLDLGVQPLGYPNGVISAVMGRDRILRSALANAGTPLAAHAFKRGADMTALLADGRLDAGLVGDMPATMSAAAGKVWIAGLVKVSQTAIVARGGARVQELAGKRIGYVPLSSAHSTLMRGLGLAKLDASAVTLVSIANADLPGALERNEIDAFAGWEPSGSIALAANPKSRIVFRSQSVDYFVIRREFERQHPQAARLLVAGFVRALEWMRRSPQNVQTAARWVLADGKAFTGKSIDATVPQVVAITRQEILDVPSAPAIVRMTGEMPLKVEYDLLKSLNKLPADERWDHVPASFTFEGLQAVLADPRKYATRTFDYED